MKDQEHCGKDGLNKRGLRVPSPITWSRFFHEFRLDRFDEMEIAAGFARALGILFLTEAGHRDDARFLCEW